MDSATLESCFRAASAVFRALDGQQMSGETRWRDALGVTLEALMVRAASERWPAAADGLKQLDAGEPLPAEALAGLSVAAWSEVRVPEGWVEALPRGVSDVASLATCYAALQAVGPDASTAALSRARRKRHGSYYTPRVLLDALLEPLGEAVSQVQRVCDPACGAGGMLSAVQRARIDAGRVGSASVEGLCGVDRDPIAVTLCRLALWQDAGLDADSAERIRESIVWGDALVGPPPPGVPYDGATLPPDVRGVDWARAFASIWSEGGFDLVLANPPWERIKAQAREIVRAWSPRAASSAHRAERDAILARSSSGAAARRALKDAREAARAVSHHLRRCGAFPWSAFGELNTYPLFVERCWQLLGEGGVAGLIVPSGLATDLGQQQLFAELIRRGALARFLDIENHKRQFFPAVDGRFRFALVEMRRDAEPRRLQVAASLQHPAEQREPGRSWTVSADELAVINPETRTLALFRDAPSAERGLALQERVGAWCAEGGPNPWGVRFQRMFDMTLDADLFRTSEALEDAGAKRVGWSYRGRSGEAWWSLLEGKLFWQHDGAFGSFAGVDADGRRRGSAAGCEGQSVALGRFWVRASDVAERAERCDAGDASAWLCVRALTNPTNRRTLVAALTPPWGVGNSALLVHPSRALRPLLPLLAANLNALVLDDLARQKMGNTNINMYLLRQLPVIAPERYEDQPIPGAPTFAELIGWRTLALATGSCEPLSELASALGARRPVEACIKAEERAVLRAQIDALYVLLYGLGEAELAEILEPSIVPHRGFAILKREELERYGEFRTAQRVFDALRTLPSWARRPPSAVL